MEKVYIIDEKGYFLYEHICQICPETGEILYPNNYVEIEPKNQEGYIPKWNGQEWIYVLNCNNKTVYSKTNCLDEIRCLDFEAPENYTPIIPPELREYYIFDDNLNQWVKDFNRYKTHKLDLLSKMFNNILTEGHFFSQTLQIEVDCRRTGIKNDLQNVENLIGYLETSNQTELNIYRGYTNPETSITQYAYNVTLEQLQQLKLEMIQYGLQLYNRKWQLEDLINNASTLSDLNNISIDFTIH